MRKLQQEALEPEDKIRIFDLQKDIIDLKIRLITADTPAEKDSIKTNIEDIQNRIQGIKDSAE